MQRRYIPPQYLRNFRARSRGYLPHWEADDAFYSITYRLHDSLPVEVVRELRRERQRIQAATGEPGRPLTFLEKLEVDRLFSFCLDARLDLGFGRCHLSSPDVASIVAENLRHLDGNRHELHAWSVMPSHVHVVMRLFLGRDLERVLHSWKSYTSKKAGRLLGLRTGEPFWQKEYFDRLIRDEEDLMATMQYVIDNPRKAGLTNWPWTWRRECK